MTFVCIGVGIGIGIARAADGNVNAKATRSANDTRTSFANWRIVTMHIVVCGTFQGIRMRKSPGPEGCHPALMKIAAFADHAFRAGVAWRAGAA